MYDPVVYVSFGRFLQYLSQLVCRHGYRDWIAGRVAIDRAEALVRKFDRRYGLEKSRSQRHGAAAEGRANYILVMCPVNESTSLTWVLLRTAGDAVVDDEEWKNAWARDGRLRVEGFVLRRLPRTAAALDAARRQNEKRGKPSHVASSSWTWEMEPALLGAWRKQARVAAMRAAKGDRRALNRFLKALAAAPGSRGVRTQVVDLGRYLNRELHRRKVQAHNFDRPPRYLRFRKARKYPLSFVAERWRSGAHAFFA